MPFYEYQCTDCGHRIEALQKMSDDPLVYCPECNEASLKKLISAAAFQLKGTGWYETDFKHGAKGKDDKSKDKSKAKSDSSGSSKPEKTSSSDSAKAKSDTSSSKVSKKADA